MLAQNPPREHFLYLNLIRFLAPLYPSVCQDKIENLSSAAYRYFCFLLAFDDFLDQNSDKKQSFLNLLNGLESCEEAIKTLAGLYPEPTTFWQHFQACKQGYFKAVITEKALSTQQADFDETLFQDIAKGKSAVCLNSVYALSVLAGDDYHNEALISCINELHIALQYVDDIDDFKKDAQEKQWTYPHFLLKTYLLNQGLVYADLDIILQQKHLFLSGIAHYCLNKAINHYQNAEKIVSDLGLGDFATYLKKQRKVLLDRIAEIDFLIAKTAIKAQKSQVLIPNNSLTNAIEQSKNYILAQAEADNTWSDFMTSAGTGKAWITGYVGMMLAEINPDLSILQKVKERILNQPEHFLSYNESILQDADSTNFVLGFLALMQAGISAEFIQHWRFFQNANNGWATYKDETKLRTLLEIPEDVAVSAWLQAHVCVSAVAANILHLLGDDDLYAKTCQHLLDERRGDYWESYWWTSPVYATAFGVTALCRRAGFRSQALASAQYLAKLQSPEGYWLNPHQEQANALYTALALKALMVFDATMFSTNIETGINWLVAKQCTDGSWQSNRILRIPATDESEPEKVEKWRNSSFGVNCITDDHNRVFTTATVWNCLAQYNQKYPPLILNLLKENISFHVFDDTRWVIHTPEGRNVLINEPSFRLVKILQNSLSMQEAHETFNADFGVNSSWEIFEKHLESTIGGYGILQEDTKTDRPSMKNQYLKLKVQLIPDWLVAHAVKPFTFLYKPFIFYALSVICLIVLYALASPSKAYFKTSPVDLGLIATFFYASMLVHELGHIGACASNKLKHGGIGFGFYFIMPVMYADITNIWLADKKSRVIANLAGIYNELIYATILVSAGYYLHNINFFYAGMSITIFNVWEFNPFVRFDGYWVLSDLTNTPNLMQKSSKILANVFKQIIHFQPVSLEKKAVWLFLYGFINYLFVWGFMAYIVFSSWDYIIGFPSDCIAIWRAFWQGQNLWDLVDRRQLMVLTFYILLLKFLFQYIQKFYRLGLKGSAEAVQQPTYPIIQNN